MLTFSALDRLQEYFCVVFMNETYKMLLQLWQIVHTLLALSLEQGELCDSYLLCGSIVFISWFEFVFYSCITAAST